MTDQCAICDKQLCKDNIAKNSNELCENCANELYHFENHTILQCRICEYTLNRHNSTNGTGLICSRCYLKMSDYSNIKKIKGQH
jgi:hypothetical protein